MRDSVLGLEEYCFPSLTPEQRAPKQENSGLHSDYYQLPEGACELQDLIEAKGMNFSVGNIFKATYRLGSCDHSDKKRDLEKILFFAQRELDRL